jgi:hypothetical protein
MSDKDVLGQSGNQSETLNHRDKSCRELQSIATIRQALTQKGGQPK